MTIGVDYSTSTMKCGSWTVVTNVRQVPGRQAGVSRRIDFKVSGRPDVRTEGILGRNLMTPCRDGERDTYPSAGNFTTTAQARGCLRTSFEDYRVRTAFDTSFRWSSFDGDDHESKGLVLTADAE